MGEHVRSEQIRDDERQRALKQRVEDVKRRMKLGNIIQQQQRDLVAEKERRAQAMQAHFDVSQQEVHRQRETSAKKRMEDQMMALERQVQEKAMRQEKEREDLLDQAS